MAGVALYALCEPGSGEVRYIGYSKNPHGRFKSHCKPSNHKTYKRDWIASLSVDGLRPSMQILCWVQDNEEAKRIEVALIALHKNRGACLTNATLGGDGAMAGLRHTEEAKAKIGAAFRGKRLSAEHRAKVSAARKGMKFTPEHCANISASFGNQTNEQRALRSAKISAAGKGRKASSETRAKLSAAHTGVKRAPFTFAHLARMSEVRKGVKRGPHSIETRTKIGAALAGKKRPSLPPEQRAKLSVALKAYWSAKRSSS